MNDDEIFIDVVGFEGLYQVSDLGRVKSLGRRVNGLWKNGFYVRERILKQSIDSGGYYNVSLAKDGKAKTFTIHRIVATAFLPNPENKPEVNHKNGIKNDSRLENLEWATEKENINHAIDTGLFKVKGEDNPAALLTEADVLEIRRKYIKRSRGYNQYTLAAEYGISQTNICDILLRKIWQHI